MKVAIFSPYATVVPHFDTDLEIAQSHLDAGDSVEFMHCLGELANCDFNQHRDAQRCDDCKGRREMGLELLQPNVPSQTFAAPLVSLNSLRQDFETVDELIDYKIETFDIGYAALSSLVSICRDPEPDLVKHRTTLNRFLQSALQAYQSTRSYLQSIRPDRVYVFNGRIAATRAVLRACQVEKIDCYLHERGCDIHHYDTTKNHLIHEIPQTESVIRQHWDDAAGLPERESLASQWFIERVERVERDWHSFVKHQTAGALPDEWDSSRKNISIFCSSDDEFVAIGDCWRNEMYPNQVAAIADIATAMRQIDPKVRLTLRVHPNLAQVENARKRDMLNLDFPNLTIIPPDSPIDSYALLRASDCVASFGSSIGIEAVYWERPSVLLGPCLYQNLGGVYRPRSHEETIQLLNSDLTSQSKIGALTYAYWIQTRGQRFQYFSASGLFDGQFKGQTLYARPPKKTFATRICRAAGKLLSPRIS